MARAFTELQGPDLGFVVVAGPPTGLGGFLLAVGGMAAGEVAPPHLHHGDELIRLLSGEVRAFVGDEVRTCGAGDVISVPADVLHGFRVLADVRMEVVSVIGAGQHIPVRDGDEVRLVEVFRHDLPWGRTPPAGVAWTSDPTMAALQEGAMAFLPDL